MAKANIYFDGELIGVSTSVGLPPAHDEQIFQQMQLVPITIQDIKDSSAINVPNTVNVIRLTFNVEVVSTGDFSKFVNDGKVDVEKLIVAIFKGNVYISTISKQ